MTISVAINGFGRIGRMVLRNAINDENIHITAINASYPSETIAHLIKYDTIHGKFPGKVVTKDHSILIDGQEILIVNNRNPERLPWSELDIDIVVEATGKFNNRDKAAMHLHAGAKKVVLTAPGVNADATIVMGVNEEVLNMDKHHIISNASCTTNCLGPIAKVIDKHFTIKNGLMTTIHSFTNDQNNIDNPHNDLRRARSCGQNIIPTSTGAAKALKEILPHLEGKLHGMALRVPTQNVSLVDLVVDLEKNVTRESVNRAFEKESTGNLKGILAITEEPLVSIDFNTTTESATIDALSTMVIGHNKVKILAWYDNEWGYSNRVVDLVKLVGSKMIVKMDSQAV
ncbi:glyceraldehyde-3-phosphate dehydrogenase [Niallia sp. Sow4_A1]|jgi:glyceraldehyde 3-phosphate dehydrogenase|uniref:Glyceraldehyde-3-phosphate dehydrogenase n=1 Tax=Niallia hominis TaxID=3133173 RepID=A0ABV1F4E8_9BACI|nr:MULTISPECIES: glyceraldehyde-3-phosphate dehydrogenase [Niallia]MCF2648311.1 glyceraldehyde-3-phosphate dehydrogenase [Niallia circulans]MCM3362171.1 glyceraldehyde-3-phosphate dehydrogenase [Niallia sp. MER TA 168]